jgi:GDPmannose 4,6-dehydratase
MWLMLQQREAADYVIATGAQYTVREFIGVAAAALGMPLAWKGEGEREKGFDRSGRCIVEIDPRYFQPAEVDELKGDASKARDALGWRPQISFEQLVTEMAHADLALARTELAGGAAQPSASR